MPIPEILHAESFRYNGEDWPTLYVSNSGNYARDALHVCETPANTMLQRLQWGRGSAPQGWALRGDPFGFNRGWGIKTTQMMTPRSPGPTIGVAFAHSQGGHVGNSLLCELGTEDGREKLLSIETDGAGHLIICDGTGLDGGTVQGAVLATSTYVLPPGTALQTTPHTHLEIRCDGTARTVEIFANSLRVLTLPNKFVGAIGLVHHIVQLWRVYTDYVIHDGSARLGDCRAIILPAVTPGTYVAGTATGAGSLVLAVGDIDHNEQVLSGAHDDDTYGALDDTGLPKGMSFTTDPLPADCKQVFAAGPFALARKDDAGVDTTRLLLVSGATETTGADVAMTDAYTPYARLHMTDPHTATAWTIPAVDAAQVGLRRTA